MRSSVDAPGRGRLASAAARPEGGAPSPERVMRVNAPRAARKVAATARSLKRLGRASVIVPRGRGRGPRSRERGPSCGSVEYVLRRRRVEVAGRRRVVGLGPLQAESKPACGEGTYGNVDRYGTSLTSTPSPRGSLLPFRNPPTTRSEMSTTS